MMLLSVCKAADRIGVSGPHYISLPAKFVTAPVRFATDWSGAKLRIQMHVPVSISPRRRASVTSGWRCVEAENDRCLESRNAASSCEIA